MANQGAKSTVAATVVIPQDTVLRLANLAREMELLITDAIATQPTASATAPSTNAPDDGSASEPEGVESSSSSVWDEAIAIEHNRNVEPWKSVFDLYYQILHALQTAKAKSLPESSQTAAELDVERCAQAISQYIDLCVTQHRARSWEQIEVILLRFLQAPATQTAAVKRLVEVSKRIEQWFTDRRILGGSAPFLADELRAALRELEGEGK